MLLHRIPHSETGLSLWWPPEPGIHCRWHWPASDVNRRLEFSAANWRLTCSMSLFRNNLTKAITAIPIWRFMHFYRILYCLYIFVQWSSSNCDSATLKMHFCNNNNNNNSINNNCLGPLIRLARVDAHSDLPCYQSSCCSVFQAVNYRQPSFSGCRRRRR